MYQKKGQGDLLDPQVKCFLDEINSEESVEFGQLSLDEIRGSSSIPDRYLLKKLDVDVKEITMTTHAGKKLAMRVYKKDLQIQQAPLMFFHGGCWVFCGLDSHDALCRKLCYDSGFTVISVDYRLSPENKFPQGLEDCYDATQWVRENYEELQLKDEDVILCGDSAGGNLAIGVSTLAHQRNSFKVRGQILFYPITDVSKLNTVSYQVYSKNYFLTKETISACSDYYVSNKEEKQNALVSPLLAEHIEGVPRTLIQTAEFDILRDEAEAYGNKLEKEGVEVTCTRYNGLIHAYLALSGGVEFASEALEDAVDFLRSFDL